MTAIILLMLFVLGLAALAPRFGKDSRGLDDQHRVDTYPGTPTR